MTIDAHVNQTSQVNKKDLDIQAPQYSWRIKLTLQTIKALTSSTSRTSRFLISKMKQQITVSKREYSLGKPMFRRHMWTRKGQYTQAFPSFSGIKQVVMQSVEIQLIIFKPDQENFPRRRAEKSSFQISKLEQQVGLVEFRTINGPLDQTSHKVEEGGKTSIRAIF